MGKGGEYRANLRTTRTQIQNAGSSAQARAFRAREIAKQKRATAERALRAKEAAAKAAREEATETPAPLDSANTVGSDQEGASPTTTRRSG
jgi:hypothetical protein